jgi:hypothetical protein
MNLLQHFKFIKSVKKILKCADVVLREKKHLKMTKNGFRMYVPTQWGNLKGKIMRFYEFLIHFQCMAKTGKFISLEPEQILTQTKMPWLEKLSGYQK